MGFGNTCGRLVPLLMIVWSNYEINYPMNPTVQIIISFLNSLECLLQTLCILQCTDTIHKEHLGILLEIYETETYIPILFLHIIIITSYIFLNTMNKEKVTRT